MIKYLVFALLMFFPNSLKAESVQSGDPISITVTVTVVNSIEIDEEDCFKEDRPPELICEYIEDTKE